jgi:hypothetical protein
MSAKRAVAGDGVDEITLRENADEFRPLVLNDQCSDTPLSELSHRIRHDISGADLENIMIFAMEDIGNQHDRLARQFIAPRASFRLEADKRPIAIG